MTIEKKFDAIVAGDVFIDLILTGFHSFPKPGEEAFAEDLARDIGGGAAITACGLARLGMKTALLAVTGEDESAWFSERLKGCGVDSSLLLSQRHERTGITVSASTEAERTMFTYTGANRTLQDRLMDPELRQELTSAKHVHLACALAPEVLLELAAGLRAAGCRVSVDVGWHRNWLADPRSLTALREADVFMPNEREAELMTGERGVDGILRAFERAGMRAVALKLGDQGAALLCNRATHRRRAHPAVPVDTTGAGDSFDAGFIYGLLRGEPPSDCLKMATVCGALSTEAAGGIAAFPSRAQLEEALRQDPR